MGIWSTSPRCVGKTGRNLTVMLELQPAPISASLTRGSGNCLCAAWTHLTSPAMKLCLLTREPCRASRDSSHTRSAAPNVLFISPGDHPCLCPQATSVLVSSLIRPLALTLGANLTVHSPAMLSICLEMYSGLCHTIMSCVNVITEVGAYPFPVPHIFLISNPEGCREHLRLFTAVKSIDDRI